TCRGRSSRCTSMPACRSPSTWTGSSRSSPVAWEGGERNSEGLPERQVDEPLLLIAEADVDPREDRLRDGEADTGTVAVLEMRHQRVGECGAQLTLHGRPRLEDASALAEHRAPDANVPEMDEVELVDGEAILEVQEHALGPEEAAGEEAADRVVATDP